MALTKERNREIRKQVKILPPTYGSSSPDDPTFTGRDKAILGLAKMVVVGVLILTGMFGVGLFFLILTNKPDALMLKDTALAFIAVASGILGSILGYYYKSNEK